MENGNTFVKLISVSWFKENEMSILKEFRDFAMRGNVVDLAVGVIIGAAFGKIVSSLVDDVITPALLNPALKAVNAENLSQLVIPGTAIKYGNFLSAFISFTVIAFVLFLLIKAANKVSKPAEAAPEKAEQSAFSNPDL